MVGWSGGVQRGEKGGEGEAVELGSLALHAVAEATEVGGGLKREDEIEGKG